MIELEVEEYCQNGCRAFEPESTTIYDSNGAYSTKVFCERARVCEQIYRYLKRNEEKADGAD